MPVQAKQRYRCESDISLNGWSLEITPTVTVIIITMLNNFNCKIYNHNSDYFLKYKILKLSDYL